MKKQLFVVFAVFLLAFEAAKATPYVTAVEAQSQLDELRQHILGEIQAAQDEFELFYSEIEAYSVSVKADGEISIDQVHAEVSAQLVQIKQLAADANKNIAYCTGGREQMINHLPTELKERIDTCIVTQNEEAATVLDSSKYLVDITINKVSSLEFQLRVCGDSESCIAPIVTLIDDYIVNIPQEIKVEVDNAEQLILSLKSIVKQCGDNNVADFTGYVTELIEQIATCANRIIGS